MQEHDERHSDVWQEERDLYYEGEQNDCGCMLMGWAEFVDADRSAMSEELTSLCEKIDTSIVTGRM